MPGSGKDMKLAPSERTLIVQPLPGIGDMIWHLPHIHAIARTTSEGLIDLLAKPRSRADQLLGTDPTVRRILWLERDSSRHSGLTGTIRLVTLLRQARYQRVWILHDSARYALVARLAGIPERIGYGFGAQGLWLKEPTRLPRQHRRAHPIAKADALLELYDVARTDDDGHLHLDPHHRERVQHRFAHLPQPWITLGIGSSESWKQWGERNFAELAIEIVQRGWGLPVLIGGGPREAALANSIANQVQAAGANLLNGVNLTVAETAALISCSRFYIGNDTGFLNVAAALGVDALGLFGSSPPLSHSPFIHVLLPDGEQSCDYSSRNMAGISVDAVLRRAAILLAD